MDLRKLSYFLEVAKHKSFSRASKSLHVSQPTISKAIKDLESDLDVILFDRTTRQINLTDMGEITELHGHIIMKSVKDFYTELNEVTQRSKGSFKLGLPPVIGASFFLKAIVKFHQLYPEIKIKLVEDGAKVLENSLIEGSTDLGVAILPIDKEVFEVMPIVQSELKLVVNPNHYLAQKNKVHLYDLKEEPMIIFQRGFKLYDRIWDACIQEGFEPKIIYETSQMNIMVEMVTKNFGFSLLPETVCRKLDPDQVTVIPDIEPKFHWNPAIIWRKDSYLSPPVKEWIKFVSEYFK